MSKMKNYAIILAGGEGRRAGGSVPKQFQELAGRPIVWWSMHAFYKADCSTEIIVVVHPGFIEEWELFWKDMPDDMHIPYKICCGGRTRAESVRNGLMMIDTSEDSYIAIHDAARPLVSQETIKKSWEIIRTFPDDGVAPCAPLTDSIRQFDNNECDLAQTHSVVRADYVSVQTPQTFRTSVIKAAYTDYDYVALSENRAVKPEMKNCTDDLSFAELYGVKTRLFYGIGNNMKVTNPEDFLIADALLKNILSD